MSHGQRRPQEAGDPPRHPEQGLLDLCTVLITTRRRYARTGRFGRLFAVDCSDAAGDIVASLGLSCVKGHAV